MSYQNVVENNRGVPNWVIERYCPSVFQTSAWDGVSAQYAVISTGSILAELQTMGFTVVKAMQSRSRDDSKRAYTKHALTLVRDRDLGVRGDKFTVHLVNSFDAGSAYVGYLGYLRYACTNGLVMGTFANTFRVLHRGSPHDVVESTLALVQRAEVVTPLIETLQSTALTVPEENEFAEFALHMRFGAQSDYSVKDILHRYRQADYGHDAWTVYNVLQEKVVNGFDSQDWRLPKARKITSIDSLVEFNVELWEHATSYL